MSYEHCDKHDSDATNGCPQCHEESHIPCPTCGTQWEKEDASVAPDEDKPEYVDATNFMFQGEKAAKIAQHMHKNVWQPLLQAFGLPIVHDAPAQALLDAHEQLKDRLQRTEEAFESEHELVDLLKKKYAARGEQFVAKVAESEERFDKQRGRALDLARRIRVATLYLNQGLKGMEKKKKSMKKARAYLQKTLPKEKDKL